MKSLKKHSLLFILILCFGMRGFAQGNFYPNIEFAPQVPLEGHKLDLTYDASSTPVANQKQVQAVIYYFKDYQWRGDDIMLQSAGANKWKGSYQMPAAAAFFTLKFVAGDSVDNNQNRSYGLMTQNEKQNNLPGSQAAWGLMRSPKYGWDIPNYLDGSKSIGDSVTHMWLERELQNYGNPTAQSTFAVPFAQSLKFAYGDERIENIKKIVAFLTKPASSQEDMLKASYILSDIIGEPAKSDSLNKVIVQRFDDQNFAKLAAYKAYFKEANAEKNSRLAEEFLNKYPIKQANRWFDQVNRIEYDRAFLTAVLTRIEANNFSSIDTYLDQLPFMATVTIYYKTIEVSHIRKTIPDDFLYQYSEKLIKHLETFRNNPAAEYSTLSPLEWQKQFNEVYISGVYRPMAFTHIEICKNTGRTDEALKYAELAQEKQQFKKADLNDAYVHLLAKKGKAKEVQDALIKSIYENQASSEMIEMLKEDYLKSHESADGFNDYLQSLKNVALTKNNSSELEMLNKKMVEWQMYDANNKLITSASLKGKTVVLDFWATWCVPCKASFPGMKLAVERYKNDPDVIFYFVDTEERTATYKAEVKKYIKDNNYPFQVLFDNPVAKGAKETGEVFNRVSKAFTISGIPQKLFIDKSGTLRYISIGFKGSASALADDISEMVELTKKQK